MKRKLLVFILTLALVLAAAQTTALAAAAFAVSVTVFTTNDIHGNVESASGVIGLAQAAAIKASTDNAVLVDAGDATQGASFATVDQGESVIELMNAAGYDVMAAGNHEFDYGADRLLANAKAADFPILAANVKRGGAPLLEESAVVTVAGVDIGFIGLTTADTATSTNPAQLTGVTFADELETAKAQIAKLADVDAIVLICHMGENDKAVACTSDELLAGLTEAERAKVAAVVDGHSHETYADEYEGIPIVQAGVNGSSMGRVDITVSGADVSATGSVLSYDDAVGYELTDKGTAAKAKVEAALKTMKDAQKDLLGKTLCTTSSPLWGGYIYYDYVESRIVETAYGDFVTDAFVDSAKIFAKNNNITAPVIAVENGGGIAQTMPMGTVTRGDILNAFNHGNTVVVLSVTPAQLYTALEIGLTMTGQGEDGHLVRERVSGSFLQAGGFKYAYDPAGEAGQKVVSVTLDDGTAFKRDDTTTKLLLATNNYTATFDGLADGEKLGELGGEDQIVEDYILARTKDGTETLTYPITQGRITLANDKSPDTYTVKLPLISSADKKSPAAGRTVELSIDGGEYKSYTSDGAGTVTLTLAKGPHELKLKEDAKQVVYVNNYSGSGTVTTKDGYYTLGFTVKTDSLPFTDVPESASCRADVEYVYENGIMNGVSSSSFDPNGVASRAMAVQVLWNMSDKPAVDYLMTYSDVKTGQWFAESVRWATSEGVVTGRGNGTFGPSAPLTREQMAAMIYRYEQKNGGGFTGDWMFRLDYTDAASVSQWAFEAVCWCSMNNIFQAETGAALNPQAQVTRAELAHALSVYGQLD